MQNREIANTMGVNTNWINTFTFSFGSALAGLTGAIYAPIMAVTPTFGNNFMTQGFVTVIVGGSNPILGTLLSGVSLGIVQAFLSMLLNTFWGKIGILTVAIIFVRILPNGFSGFLKRRK
jgi:branched-chain amino acid transport system permease protein